jgi:erythromycin esterase-like protein/predicted phosphoribosyltransferase
MKSQFLNRIDAGKNLASVLTSYIGKKDTLVLALPRGGVPVAHEVAKALSLPLDVWLVRKLGVPGHEELAMGAVAAGGICHIDNNLTQALGIPKDQVDQVIKEELIEMARRNKLYRQDRPVPVLKGKTVIIVDDGLATGATMRAAILSLRQAQALRIIVAAPVAALSTCMGLREIADEVICLYTPEPFYGVGQWYDDFSQVSDGEVITFLGQHEQEGKKEESVFVAALKRHILPLEDSSRDYDVILEAAQGRRFVLMGEATHGSKEFYHARAVITRRLIEEAGFDGVVVEADWPDAWRVNRYVTHRSGEEAEEALSGFERFPSWMWHNNEVLDFIKYLHASNQLKRQDALPVGFYGLDLYSLHSSAEAVISYLKKIDPEAAQRARNRYSCLDPFIDDLQSYGYTTTFGITESCEREIIAQLTEMRSRAFTGAARTDSAEDEYFCARQNAKLVRNSEQYYRAMFRGHPSSWNVRDMHMLETMEDLHTYLSARLGREARLVVWAHNSHIGNASATEMAWRGEYNIGQLVREKYGNDCLLIGFSTSSGHVTAADNWDGPALRKKINPPFPGSYEEVFSSLACKQFLVDLRLKNEATDLLRESRLQHAIGVVYRPETERESHYFFSQLTEQFDFLIHFDKTSVLHPLESMPHWHRGDMDETYPYGL